MRKICANIAEQDRGLGVGNGAAQSSGVEKPVLKNTAARLRAFRQQSKRQNNLECGEGGLWGSMSSSLLLEGKA